MRVERYRESDDVKYEGAVPLRIYIYMYIIILKLILSLIDSQCNLRRHWVRGMVMLGYTTYEFGSPILDSLKSLNVSGI